MGRASNKSQLAGRMLAALAAVAMVFAAAGATLTFTAF
jgi:hypothetical protein